MIEKSKTRTIWFCYINYFLSGIVMLSFGAILPSLIEQKGLNYTVAAALLTCLTIGNFFSSIVYPALGAKLGRKLTTVILCLFYPIGLFLFTLVGNITVMFAVIFFVGINKGVITLTNNMIVNEITGSSHRYVNLLHVSFAIGAFLSPFLIALVTAAGIDWTLVMRMIAVVTAAVPVLYAFSDFGGDRQEDKASQSPEKEAVKNEGGSFFKETCFWIAVVMMFCYMGLETTVNGLFNTYLQDTGIMSNTLATMMVSVTWIMMMVGRLIVAAVATKVSKAVVLLVTSCVQFAAIVILLNSSTTVMVVAALALLGLGFAGISPTLMSFTGKACGNATLGMSVLMAFNGTGSFFLPQLIGIVADHSGFGAAIWLMGINSILLVILGAILVPKAKRRGIQ